MIGKILYLLLTRPCRVRSVWPLLVVMVTINTLVFVLFKPFDPYRTNKGAYLRDYFTKTTNSNEVKNIEKRFKNRRMTLSKICDITYRDPSTLDLTFNEVMYKKSDKIYIDEENKFVYCMVPKVASTSWRKLMLKVHLNKTWQEVNDYYFKLETYLNIILKTPAFVPQDKLKEIFGTYTTFLIVRDPYERILSAWRNKFQEHPHVAGRDWYCDTYGKNIIKKYRNNELSKIPSYYDNLKDNNTDNDSTVGNYERSCDVTFNEFVRYLLDRDFHHDWLDEHWRSVQQLCHPCHVKYQYVLKYETLLEDSNYILEKIGWRDKVHFGQTKTGVSKVKSRSKLTEGYHSIMLKDFHKLYLKYGNDFKMFGYQAPPI
ncbi:unnamed protein product [Owenia fusiformis]|uniref:Carbohydrate sulfotransferase n=1 Tax=Owenia fusiformis TaxID=6347 RepID=A0A8J1TL47_OWEFU|nr:unnamed protein product [Owenia fusiformis]